jgi:hypothetical protein
MVCATDFAEPRQGRSTVNDRQVREWVMKTAMVDKVRGWFRRAIIGSMAGLATWGLIACGGSTGAIEPFKPTRMMVFGDELSVLLPNGTKYTVNALTAGTTTVDCALHPLWVQTVASAFSLTFAECNPNGVVSPAAQMYAQAGARASDVGAQLSRAAAAKAFNDKDLATVYFGYGDLLELYAQYPARPLDALTAEARTRGSALGSQVNNLARSGPAVLLLTAPDLGLAPFGAQQTAAFPGETNPTRAKVLSSLTDAFNAGLRVTIINDGRLIGLVSSDQMLRDIQPPFSAFYGFADLTTPLCVSTVTILNCTTNTLVSGGDTTSWGFATNTLFGPALQSRLGQLAASRALRNPF